MADLTVTVASIALRQDTTLPSAAQTQVSQFGEAANQGECLYLAADGKYYKADNNDTAIKAGSNGLALALTKVGAADAFGVVLLAGDIDLGDTLAVGQAYAVSSNAGKICPESDLDTGDYYTLVGIGMATNRMRLLFKATGAQHA